MFWKFELYHHIEGLGFDLIKKCKRMASHREWGFFGVCKASELESMENPSFRMTLIIKKKV